MKLPRRQFLHLAAGAAALPAIARVASAETYPARPIRLVVPFPPAQMTLGVLAPSGTPKSIIDQIAQANQTALTERAYQDFLIEGGFEPTPDTSSEKFRRTLEQDVALWRPVVEALGLKID